MNCSRVYLALLFVFAAVTSGCSSSSRPEMGYCTGTVTMDGKPVESVTVVMKPDVGRMAMGVTDKNGVYDMEYTLGERGTKVGPTTVSFEWPLGYAAPFAIPSKYNQVNSKEKIDVKPGENEFNFTLEADAAAPSEKPATIVD